MIYLISRVILAWTFLFFWPNVYVEKKYQQHKKITDKFSFIDLQPDNLPTKRIWSKKYPIRIQASTRKPFSTEEATQKMAAHDDIPDEAESKANDTDEDEMLDAKEHLDEDLGKKFFLSNIYISLVHSD